MARTWLSITVELVEGRAQRFWPRPGREFAAARSHTFAELARAIDDAFARWDRSHLFEFRFADERRIGLPDPEWDMPGDEVLDARRMKLSQLGAGEQFVYVFDFGDGWHHICTVREHRIDPLETFGIEPDRPLPYWGWGGIPRGLIERFSKRRRAVLEKLAEWGETSARAAQIATLAIRQPKDRSPTGLRPGGGGRRCGHGRATWCRRDAG